MEKFKEKITKLFNQFLSTIIIVVCLTCGFTVGYYYQHIINNEKDTKPVIKTKQEIKIAVDDAGNLLIINSQDGKYQVFQDSIGFTILNLYANKLISKK